MQQDNKVEYVNEDLSYAESKAICDKILSSIEQINTLVLERQYLSRDLVRLNVEIQRSTGILASGTEVEHKPLPPDTQAVLWQLLGEARNKLLQAKLRIFERDDGIIAQYQQVWSLKRRHEALPEPKAKLPHIDEPISSLARSDHGQFSIPSRQIS